MTEVADRQPLYRKVGRFEPRELLGRGGFADVFLAYDPREDREIALKALPLEGTTDSAEILQAEASGARIQQQLNSVAPQVAEVYEYGKDGGYFYIAMEYIDGVDLARALTRGPFTEERAIAIARQLCEMLETSHCFEAEVEGRTIDGIVHGDLKPGNIRLQEDDRVRVFDFGIAKYLSSTRRFTQSRGHSIPYASPERLERGIIDRRSDLWSIGVILYEMVSGRHPYRGRNDFELEKAIVDGAPEALPEGCCSHGLERLIRTALAYNPDHRPADASELKSALDLLPDEDPELASRPANDDLTRRTSEVTDDRTHRTVENDRTHRTVEDDRTRRTEPSQLPDLPLGARQETETWDTAFLASSSPETTPASEPRQAGKPRRSLRRWQLWRGQRPWQLLRHAGCVGLAIAFGVLPVSQFIVYAQARNLREDLARGAPEEVHVHWQRFQGLDRFAVLGLSVLPVKQPLREALLTSANRVIIGYEVDLPRPDLPWSAAAENLRSALALGANAAEVRAKMYYCQGHVDRIAAKELEREDKPEEAGARRNEAVVNFREAARLAPTWYAPFLGLARIHAYDDFDLEKLEDDLNTAEDLGFNLGKREAAQLADGHHHQCRRLRLQSEAGLSRREQRRLLSRARSHCRESLRLYRGIFDYASASNNLAWAERTLEKVESQLLY